MMTSRFTLHEKNFRALDNESGLSNSETIFTYKQSESLLTGEYCGGEISFGNIVGKFVVPDVVELVFQCVTKNNELLTGRSKGILSETGSGQLAISFEWEWLSGSSGSGHSYHVQVEQA